MGLCCAVVPVESNVNIFVVTVVFHPPTDQNTHGSPQLLQLL